MHLISTSDFAGCSRQFKSQARTQHGSQDGADPGQRRRDGRDLGSNNGLQKLEPTHYHRFDVGNAPSRGDGILGIDNDCRLSVCLGELGFEVTPAKRISNAGKGQKNPGSGDHD